MPQNPKLFPNSFSGEEAQEGASSGIEGIEDSVEDLRRNAVRQSSIQLNSIRNLGYKAAQSQHQQVKVLKKVLPAQLIGRKKEIPINQKGKVGYWFGGWRSWPRTPLGINSACDKIVYEYEIVRPASLSGRHSRRWYNRYQNVWRQIKEVRQAAGRCSVGNAEDGFSQSGGWGFYRISYSNDSFSRLGFRRFRYTKRSAAMQGRFNGYLAGGLSGSWHGGAHEDRIDRFMYLPQANLTIESKLYRGKDNASGFTSTTHGYVGCGRHERGSFLGEVDRMDFLDESTQLISQNFTGRYNAGLDAPGNESSAYIIGGRRYARFPTVTDPYRWHNAQVIERFDFNGGAGNETIQSVGETRWNHYAGSWTYNQNAGYCATQRYNEQPLDELQDYVDPWYETHDEVFKLDFATENYSKLSDQNLQEPRRIATPFTDYTK